MEAFKLHFNRKLDESDIIDRVLNGEKDFFELLIRRNNQKLYRTIRAYIKDDAEIQDVIQDSYIKAFLKLSQFRKESLFSTWLIRIAINEALAHLSKKEKTIHFRIDSDQNSDFNLPDNEQPNPQQKMINLEAKNLLEKAIDHLEPKYRIVYLLKEVEEMKIKEISKALDISESNVKVRIHRAKQMLKNSLLQITNQKEVFEFGHSRCDRLTESVMNKIFNL